MVSPKLAIITAIALLPFTFINGSYGASYYHSGLHADSAEITPFDSQKVNLSVYYASLSQPCATFIIKNLEEIFQSDLINTVNLQLVPWANAYVNKTNHSIICQNGPDECELNSLQACVLNVFNEVGRQKNWQDCFSQLDLPKEPVLNCYNTGTGTEIGQKYINEAAHLYSPHDFLPWVVVNNQSIGREYENFTRYICEAYKGIPAPATCNLH